MTSRLDDETADRDQHYQQLVELAPDGILIHDGERSCSPTPPPLRLAGATRRDQLVGQPIDTFLDAALSQGRADAAAGVR